jgi:predicted small metal-binding protein
MKAFACGSVVPGCTATFTARNEAEILACVAEHALRDHGMSEIPPEVVEQVRANVVDVEVEVDGPSARLVAWPMVDR